jgi:hypothetical protein
MQVLAMLTRQIRMLYTAKVGAAHTIQPPFLQRQYEMQARGFSESRLRTAYAALVRLDSDLKGGSHGGLRVAVHGDPAVDPRHVWRAPGCRPARVAFRGDLRGM